MCSTTRAASRAQLRVCPRPANHRHVLDRSRVRGMESGLRRLMTVDADPTGTLMSPDGSLSVIAGWSTAFASAGAALGRCAREGMLRRGIRAVLTRHVIFHWNRIGLPYTTQCTLAHAAKTVVLGE